MSYKHNNLMAMRQSYWNDSLSAQVMEEKKFFQQVLMQYEIFPAPTAEDAKHLFFSFPSIIIVKGYASGFMHQSVQKLIFQHVQSHKFELQQKSEMKIKFNI
ncbi:hypothetical protein [Acinetobacter sp.]|jgi:hypothetical protein|uniref:hypothetical protein n=1 Tax=Acinetobacter sp. TaxID=472 RepID=UPI0035AFC6C0